MTAPPAKTRDELREEIRMQAGGGTWSRKERPRVDTHPTQGKFCWERTATPQQVAEPADDPG